MQKVNLVKAESRGHANYGWLDTHYSFSFSNYYNPERIHFGALRVLNDDTVQAGGGFGMHPHDNMEIITIVLSGELEHRDSMGNIGRIKAHDVQVMSAGSGLTHSEYNPLKDKDLSLFQIWIFPDRKSVNPRYDQKSFDPADRKNRLQSIVGPEGNNAPLWIYQNAWLHLGNLNEGEVQYSLQEKDHGLFLFMIEGSAQVEGHILQKRDALEITGMESLTIRDGKNAEFLLIEVPMQA